MNLSFHWVFNFGLWSSKLRSSFFLRKALFALSPLPLVCKLLFFSKWRKGVGLFGQDLAGPALMVKYGDTAEGVGESFCTP